LTAAFAGNESKIRTDGPKIAKSARSKVEVAQNARNLSGKNVTSIHKKTLLNLNS